MTAVAPELLVVVSTKDMSHEHFARHMSLRHRDSLGGLSELNFGYISMDHDESVVMAWRAFHRRLHALRLDLSHVHEW